MRTAEFKRFLASMGVRFAEDAKHSKLYLNGKQSMLPRHAKELGYGLRTAILRQLNIKEGDDPCSATPQKSRGMAMATW